MYLTLKFQTPEAIHIQKPKYNSKGPETRAASRELGTKREGLRNYNIAEENKENLIME